MEAQGITWRRPARVGTGKVSCEDDNPEELAANSSSPGVDAFRLSSGKGHEYFLHDLLGVKHLSMGNDSADTARCPST